MKNFSISPNVLIFIEFKFWDNDIIYHFIIKNFSSYKFLISQYTLSASISSSSSMRWDSYLRYLMNAFFLSSWAFSACSHSLYVHSTRSLYTLISLMFMWDTLVLPVFGSYSAIFWSAILSYSVLFYKNCTLLTSSSAISSFLSLIKKFSIIFIYASILWHS